MGLLGLQKQRIMLCEMCYKNNCFAGIGVVMILGPAFDIFYVLGDIRHVFVGALETELKIDCF